MSDMYAIKGSTLTALGDAVRSKLGITFYEPEQFHVISSTPVVQTTLSKYTKNKFVIDIIDMACGEYDSIKISNTKGATLYQNNIRKMVFPLTIEAECQQIYCKFELTNNATYFADYTITTIPLDEDGKEYKYTPLQMAEEINNMLVGPSAEDLIITGDCNYRFAYGGWDWFVNKYGDLITTKDIKECKYMFYFGKLKNIPFDINFTSSKTAADSMFNYSSIQTVPKLLNLKVSSLRGIFSDCNYLREIREDLCDTWDWSYLDTLTSGYSGDCSKTLNSCYRLRKFPMVLFQHGNPVSNYNYAVWCAAFSNCHCLDEIVGLPNPHYSASYTGSGYSSPFNTMINNCYRLKRFTFAPMDPPKWSNQTLDFTFNVGWAPSDIGSTIGADAPRITDDATYQEYKDHPDSWTTKVEYSRYNRISAVETINSLPDTSTTGTANSIKFKGAAGSLTDGGAINTMTDEEIAVATAKGWTVIFA